MAWDLREREIDLLWPALGWLSEASFVRSVAGFLGVLFYLGGSGFAQATFWGAHFGAQTPTMTWDLREKSARLRTQKKT